MTSKRAEGFSSIAALAALLFTAALAHVALWQRAPERPEWTGDELYYLAWARKWADWGEHSLVPGRLGLHHRPPLALNVFAHLARPDEDGKFRYKRSRAILFARLRVFHIVLLLATLGFLYTQGRLLGLGPAGSLVAPALLGAFPWFGFYVHSAWADPLRTALLSLAFVFLLAFLRRPQLVLLVPAGVAYGFAVLARSSYLHFLPVAMGLVAGAAWLDLRERPSRARILRATAAAGVLAAASLASVGPQLVANWRDGYGLRLATNTWRNVDFGLLGPAPSDPEDAGQWREAAKKAYLARRGPLPETAPARRGDPLHAEALDYVAREQHAKQRTLAFLRETPIPTLLRRQTEKVWLLISDTPSHFEKAVTGERWGPERSARLAWLVGPSRALWYAIVALGLAGLAVVGWTSPGWMLVSAFALYFLAGLFVAPLSTRFLVAFAPTLCLLAGGALTCAARTWTRWRSRQHSNLGRIP